MINFIKENNLLQLVYSSEGDMDWVTLELDNNDVVSLKNTFKLLKKHLNSKDDNGVYFRR